MSFTPKNVRMSYDVMLRQRAIYSAYKMVNYFRPPKSKIENIGPLGVIDGYDADLILRIEKIAEEVRGGAYISKYHRKLIIHSYHRITGVWIKM